MQEEGGGVGGGGKEERELVDGGGGGNLDTQSIISKHFSYHIVHILRTSI